MRRAGKIAAAVFAALVATLVLSIGAIWVAGNTAAGRATIERLTYRFTAGQVRLTALAGSFPAELTLGRLQLSDADGVWLEAQHVSLQWSPSALLAGRVQIDTLQAARLHVERAPRSDKKGGSTTLPHIDVARFAADRLELGAPLAGSPTTLAVRGDVQLRSLEDASGTIAAHRLDGDGEYEAHFKLDPRRIDGTLALHEPAGGPLENLLSLPGLGALRANLVVAGARSAERLDLDLDAGELHARAHGSVDLVHGSADLDYAVQAAAMTPRADVAWQRISLQGNWHGPMAAPASTAELHVDGLRIAGQTLLPRLQARLASSAGRLNVHASIEGLRIPGAQPELFAAAPVNLAADVRLDAAAKPVDFTATYPLLRLQGRAEAVAVNSAPRHATLAVTIGDLAPFAAYAGQDVRGTAKFDLQLAHDATKDVLTLSGAAALDGGKAAWIGILGPKPTLALSATLTDGGLQVDQLRLGGTDLVASAHGTAARHGGDWGDLQAHWQVELKDLARLSPEVAGDLQASGRLSGAPTALSADADLVSHLAVRGSPSGKLEATVHARGLPQSPSGTLDANGMLDGAPVKVGIDVSRRANDEYRLSIREARWKSALAQGELSSNPQLTRSRGELRLAMTQLADLNRLLGSTLSGAVSATVGFVPQGEKSLLRLQLDGTNLVVGPVAGNVRVQASGVADALALQLDAKLPGFYGSAAAVSSAAALDLSRHALRLDKLAMDYRGQTFRLSAPATVSFADGISVDRLKIAAGEAELEAKGRLAPSLQLDAAMRRVGPALVNRFSPGLLASGSFEARANVQGSTASPSGSITLDANGVRFADDAASGLPATDLHAKAQLADGSAAVRASLAAGAGSQVTVSGAVPLASAGAVDLKIGGKLDVALVNPLLEARGMHASGALGIAASVTGTAAAPVVGGGITLADGTLRDYAHGLNLSDIQADIGGNEAGLQIRTFTAKAASGTIGMTGTFGILQHGMPLDLKIVAKNAQPIASSIVTANLDADLHVSGQASERIAVAGTVHVNRATIGIPNSLPPNVAVLDVRRRGQAAGEANAKQLVVALDIAIAAPRDILVQGRGLDAELGGDIKVGGTSDDPSVAGAFNLQRGSFTISGTRMTLTTPGGVSFDGAGLRQKIDPTLDFTAETTVPYQGSTTKVVLHISGFADAPQFSFDSSLPTDEAMALILFGQPPASLSALQVAEVGAAVATLSGVGGGGGGGPLAKIQKALGLDRLTLGSDTTTSPTGAKENTGYSVAAGRYVSKRVYVEGKQTTTGTSQVEVDVDLTKHVKLQTRLGNGASSTQGTTPENDPGSSVGLSYQFEY